MMKNIFILSLFCIFCLNVNGKNWNHYRIAKSQFTKEISSGRAYGIPTNQYNFLMQGFQILAPPSYYFNQRVYGSKEANIVSGKGMVLKGMGPFVPLKIILPKSTSVCGMAIGSRLDAGDDWLDAISFAWKETANSETRAIANPLTGDIEMKLNFKTKKDIRLIFIDSYPMKEMFVKLFYRPNKLASIRIALIYDCYHKDTKFVSKCGDVVENNPTFAKLRFGVPIHIKCPTNCQMTRPCWGYKIYSSDSPICWTAAQYFGQQASGLYTLYKIERVPYFEDQANPKLNHRIYCRRFNLPYEGFTFDRLYYDFIVDRYRLMYGA